MPLNSALLCDTLEARNTPLDLSLLVYVSGIKLETVENAQKSRRKARSEQREGLKRVGPKRHRICNGKLKRKKGEGRGEKAFQHKIYLFQMMTEDSRLTHMCRIWKNKLPHVCHSAQIHTNVRDKFVCCTLYTHVENQLHYIHLTATFIIYDACIQ